MIIVEKNVGQKVNYEVNGTTVIFRDGELSLDLSRFERDFPVHIDISSNEYDMLQMGLSRKYVAQIDIPAREYEEVEVEGEEDATTEQIAKPFDIEKVTLTLWAI